MSYLPKDLVFPSSVTGIRQNVQSGIFIQLFFFFAGQIFIHFHSYSFTNLNIVFKTASITFASAETIVKHILAIYFTSLPTEMNFDPTRQN